MVAFRNTTLHRLGTATWMKGAICLFMMFHCKGYLQAFRESQSFWSICRSVYRLLPRVDDVWKWHEEGGIMSKQQAKIPSISAHLRAADPIANTNRRVRTKNSFATLGPRHEL